MADPIRPFEPRERIEHKFELETDSPKNTTEQETTKVAGNIFKQLAMAISFGFSKLKEGIRANFIQSPPPEPIEEDVPPPPPPPDEDPLLRANYGTLPRGYMAWVDGEKEPVRVDDDFQPITGQRLNALEDLEQKEKSINEDRLKEHQRSERFEKRQAKLREKYGANGKDALDLIAKLNAEPPPSLLSRIANIFKFNR